METVAILAMAGVTYLTRVGGYWLVGLTPMTPRLERFLKHLSGSILAAILAPAVVNGDHATPLGVAAAAVVMLATRRAFLALAVGVLVTSLLRLRGAA